MGFADVFGHKDVVFKFGEQFVEFGGRCWLEMGDRLCEASYIISATAPLQCDQHLSKPTFCEY